MKKAYILLLSIFASIANSQPYKQTDKANTQKLIEDLKSQGIITEVIHSKYAEGGCGSTRGDRTGSKQG